MNFSPYQEILPLLIKRNPKYLEVNKIKDNYDKFLIFVLTLVLVFLFINSFLGNSSKSREKNSVKNYSNYEINIKNGLGELILEDPHKLMPGQTITFMEENGTEAQKFDISNIVFRRKAEVTIGLTNGKKLKGRLNNQNDLRIGTDWKSVRQPLTISRNNQNINISLSDVYYIESDHKVLFKASKGVDFNDLHLSLYQSKDISSFYAETPEKPKWNTVQFESNETTYDLFTPPTIYLVDGRLTTNIQNEIVAPQKSKEQFGMELIEFSNEPYPFRLVSWIGETPYFEDMQTRQSPNSQSNVRNKLQVNVPYKRAENRRGGQPSLIPTSDDDEDKLLMIEKFVVQQYRVEKTGGMKIIGRALVRDFKLGKSFEINNQMQDVFAGNVKIAVRMTIGSLKDKIFTFTTSDVGISFDFGDRVYTVVEIDEVQKNLIVNKKGPGAEDDTEQVLSLP